MPTVLRVVRGCWAALGAANIVFMPWSRSGSGLLSVGLLVNMLLFIVPGLILFGVGQMIMARRRVGSLQIAPPDPNRPRPLPPMRQPAPQPPAPSRTVESRLHELKSLLDSSLITLEEYERRRSEILKEI